VRAGNYTLKAGVHTASKVLSRVIAFRGYCHFNEYKEEISLQIGSITYLNWQKPGCDFRDASQSLGMTTVIVDQNR
jgi:hypothetical protein